MYNREKYVTKEEADEFDKNISFFLSISTTSLRTLMLPNEYENKLEKLDGLLTKQAKKNSELTELKEKDEKLIDSFVNHQWKMGFAYISALRSEDHEIAVGAVLFDKDEILSIGYNALHPGADQINENITKDGMKEFFIVHAEKNALLYNVKENSVTKNQLTMYTTMISCDDCYPYIKKLGITLYHATYREKHMKQKKDSTELYSDNELISEFLERKEGKKIMPAINFSKKKLNYDSQE